MNTRHTPTTIYTEILVDWDEDTTKEELVESIITQLENNEATIEIEARGGIETY